MTIIRDYLVELQKYLPEFLRQDPEMKAILEVESKEHRVQVEVLKDIQAQMFIESATWGLSLFEKNLGLQPNASDNYEQRRNRIYLKLQSKRTSTAEFLAEIAKRYFSEDAVIIPKEDNPNETFYIINKGGRLLYPKDLFEAIDTYKPAHLAFALNIIREYHMEGKDAIRLATVISRGGQSFIGNAKPPNSASHIFAAAVNTTIGTKEIDFKKPDTFINGYINFAALMFSDGVKHIGANKEDIDRAKWDIKEPSCTIAKFANAILIEGQRKIFPAIPSNSEDKFHVAAVTAKDGVKVIDVATPKDSEGKTYAMGLTIKSGVKRIGANLEREPDGDLEHSLSLPKIGAALQVEGLKRLSLSTPPQSKAFSRFAGVVAKSGVIYIGANRETKRRRPHVGIMHVGRSL